MAELVPLLRKLGADRIHVHFAKELAEVGVIAAAELGARFSLTTHANDIFVPTDRGRLRRLLARTEEHYTISRFNQEFLRASCGDELADRARVFRLGIETAELLAWRAAQGEEGEEKQIVCVASGLVEKKGLSVLLEACRLLKEQGVRYRCTIIGADPGGEALDRLRADLAATGSSRHVRPVGLLPWAEAAWLTAGSDLFVLPCIRAANGDMDGIPISLMEAMGMGVPIVSTRLTGIPELVDDGRDGSLVTPGDPSELASAMRRLLEDREMFVRLGSAAAAKVRRSFTIERYASDLLGAWRR